MDKESDSPELQTGPPATDAAQNDQSISAEEAQKELLKLDSKLIDPPILEKNDRPNEEIPATEGGFVTHGKSDVDGEGDVDGK